jgi:hypothetical protein
MPIYKKIGNDWQLVASSYNSPNASLYNNVNGEWKTTKSGWVNVKGAWQQFFQTNPMSKNRLKSFVFVGDSISYGSGLPLNQQFTTIIQNHFNGIGNNGNNNTVRSLMYDDQASPIGSNAFTTTAGVKYEDVGAFSGYRGNILTYKFPCITIPINEYITLPINRVNGPILNISVSGNFTTEIYSMAYGFVPVLTDTINSVNSGSNYFYDYSSSIYNSASSVRLKTISGKMYINSVHTMSNYTYVGAEKTVGIVQVMARNSYAIEDYVDKAEDIKNNIQYKKYYDDASNSNAKPVVIIQAGLMDILNRKSSSDEYYINLNKLVTDLLKTTDIITEVDVVLTIPYAPLKTTIPETYSNMIKKIANDYNIHYVDLSALNMTEDCYQSDGINPNYKGSIKIANKYIEDLGLSTFQTNSNKEYLLPVRGL